MPKRLIDTIGEYTKSECIPFHMPGHKRQDMDYITLLGGKYDITEIPGFDDLHAPEGVLAESMELARALFGGKRVFYMTNGSTCGLQAAVYAVCPRGSSVIAARNSHISVYNAIELNELKASFIYPEFDKTNGICSSVSPRAVEDSLRKNDGVSAVIITSPTYDGVVSDIAGIARIAHRHGAKLIVDAAHGAHLGFHPYFPAAAQTLGADIVITSLHKTLPALTGAAMAIVNDKELIGPFAHAFSIFQSTSPSYLILSSIDGCMRLLEKKKDELFTRYAENIKRFRKNTEQLRNIRLIDGSDVPSAYGFDPGKILISDGGRSGREIFDLLRAQRIEPEMYSAGHALAMTGIADTERSFDALFSALLRIDGDCAGVRAEFPPPPGMLCRMSIFAALHTQSETVPEREAVGRISREYVFAYPPGTPVLAPGEYITPQFVEYCRASRENGIRFRHTETNEEALFAVCRENG